MLTKIGTGELIVILIIALFVIGPERLPKFGKAMGKAIRGLKKYVNEFTEELKDDDVDFKGIASEMSKLKKDVTDTLTGAGDDVKKAAADAGKAVRSSSNSKKAAPEAPPEAPESAQAAPTAETPVEAQTLSE